MALRAQARINLAAIERNVARLRAGLEPGAELCAVVKADGYGHGAAPVARAALGAGASAVAVVTAGEAAGLRAAGIDARIIALGAISADELPEAIASGAELCAWDEEFVRAVAASVPAAGLRAGPTKLHVKFDSGMGRLGTRDADAAVAVARAVRGAEPALALAGAMTHFATADEDGDFSGAQLAAFGPVADRIRAVAGGPITIHAANSAATLRLPASHGDLVRCGIAMYGGDPMNRDPDTHGLEPALALTSYVAAVKPIGVGESCGYGRRFVAGTPTRIATVPIGYGDGVRRGLTNNGEVLIGGCRYPIVGTVSMDNITVDVGTGEEVAIGQEVTLIGHDGAERITLEDVAARLGTINYEVCCGLSARVPRWYHRDGDPA